MLWPSRSAGRGLLHLTRHTRERAKPQLAIGGAGLAFGAPPPLPGLTGFAGLPGEGGGGGGAAAGSGAGAGAGGFAAGAGGAGGGDAEAAAPESSKPH